MEVFTESVISFDKKDLLAAELLIIIIKLFSLAVADDDVFTEEFFWEEIFGHFITEEKVGRLLNLEGCPLGLCFSENSIVQKLTLKALSDLVSCWACTQACPYNPKVNNDSALKQGMYMCFLHTHSVSSAQRVAASWEAERCLK